MSRPVLFKSQAQWFLENSANRRRHPVKPATVCTWRSCVAKWLEPNIGDLSLATINNATLKQLVSKMAEAGLSAQSIVTYVGLVKLVVASALDANGEELYPRKWNHDFIDLPVIANQHRPMFSNETVSSIVENSNGQPKVLYALLAGSGLRIGEALGVEVKHVSSAGRTLTINQSVWEGTVQSPKTPNAIRQVDLCTSLATLLRAHIGTRTSGFVFANRAGNPLAQSNVVRRSLHPLLATINVEKSGFHSFRRHRLTWLRKQRAPEDLIRFWMGHADQSVTDGYSKLSDDVIYRLNCCETASIGFALSSL
jgi:integrase